MRRGELYTLEDEQIDPTAGTITLRVTKTRRPRNPPSPSGRDNEHLELRLWVSAAFVLGTMGAATPDFLIPTA